MNKTFCLKLQKTTQNLTELSITRQLLFIVVRHSYQYMVICFYVAKNHEFGKFSIMYNIIGILLSAK